MQKNNTSAERIIEIVSMVTEVPICDIVSKSRKGPVVMARHLSMYMIRKQTSDRRYKEPGSIGNQEISSIFGRHYSTLLHSVKTIDNIRSYDKSIDGIIALIEMELGK